MPARKIKEKLVLLRPLCSAERQELSKANTQKTPSNLPLAKPGRGTKQTLVPHFSILKVEATRRKPTP